jgi:hypothetical protein
MSKNPDWNAIHKRDREIAAMTAAERKIANRIPVMCGRCGGDVASGADEHPACGATFS